MEKISPPHDDTRKSRSDGVQSRERLLLAAMRLFAEQGFAKTSTREIALAAGTNIASISYYFGDKAGLYRAAFTEPEQNARKDVPVFTNPDATLRESLLAFYMQILEPLKQGDIARLCMRLWYREMLEPTGLWDEEINNDIKPAYAGLMLVLARHLQVPEDDDLARLSFCIVGMALQLMVGREVIEEIRPQLLEGGAQIDIWAERMVDYAEAVINAEQQRRLALAPIPPSQPRKKKA
jgi:AcrR family transcriptional regulator